MIGSYKTHNMDGRAFIREVVKPDIISHLSDTKPLMVIMNLPAMAEKFLDAFIDLIGIADGSQTVASENQNIRFVLTNNSNQFINTYIQGPAGNRFGYGRPFKAGQSRDEDLPVGSKIYLVSKIGTRKLIHVVGQEYAGKDITIFENSKPAPRVY